MTTFRSDRSNRDRHPCQLCSDASAAAGRGFTLIELLVVLAIIGILASLVAGQAVRAQERARGISCMNNMRQIYLAMVGYSEDFRSLLPWAGMAERNAHEDWVLGGLVTPVPPPDESMRDARFPIHAESGAIYSYVTGRDRVWPPDPAFSEAIPIYRCLSSRSLGESRRVTYSMNSYLDPEWNPILTERRSTGWRLGEEKRSSEIVFLVDEAADSVNDGLFVPNSTEIRGDYRMHNNRPNVTYLDGHVEAMNAYEFLRIQAIPELQEIHFNPLSKSSSFETGESG